MKVLLSIFSFDKSHFRISSTELKVRITLYSTINSATEKYYSVAFIELSTSDLPEAT